MGKKGGLPDLYDQSYCKLIIDTFKNGGSLSDFCVKVGTHRRTVYKWKLRHKEFGEAYCYARECGKAWFDNYATERMNIDNSEGAMNFDVKSFIKLHSRRFMDMQRETPPPKIISNKKNPDIYLAINTLVEETLNESVTPEQSKIICNILKNAVDIKEKEHLSEKLDEIEKILKSGQQTQNIPVNSPEAEYDIATE